MSFRSLVVTRTCSLGGRLSWPFPGFCAEALTETMPSIITTTKSLSNLVICSLCLLMAYFPRMGGRKRCANPELCKIDAIHGKRETREFAHEFTKKPHLLARFRIYSHLMVQPGTSALQAENTLFPHANTQCSYVPTGVKDPQRDGVLT